jgi:hypothetical protein
MTTTTKPFKVSKVGLQLPNVEDAGATVLDWYEEGVVTTGLVLTAVTTNPSPINYSSTRSLKWTRIGNVVYFSLLFQATMTGGVGAILLGGLPYPIVDAVGARGGACILQPPDGAGLGNAGAFPAVFNLANGASTLRFVGNDFTGITCASVTANGGLFAVSGSGHYFTA